MPIPEEELRRHQIFADESCVTGHRYMVLGGIIVEYEQSDECHSHIRRLKEQMGLRHELKWEYVATKNVARYQKIVDLYFDLTAADMLHFHALVIDTSLLDHWRFNQGDGEIGFSKFVFQLLLKFSRVYGRSIKFDAYLDSRVTRHPLGPVRDMLNFQASKKYGMDHFPYRRLHFLDSKQSAMIQLTDILVGAIGYCTNGKDNPSISIPKSALAKHICMRAGLRSLALQTPATGRFTIWHMRMQRGRSVPWT